MTNNREKTVAIVVTFNRKMLLMECLDALLRQNTACDILIIDNASTDGTKDYINALLEKSKAHYFNTGKNLGGAGGFNYGIRKAYELGYDYFWLMDDDTVPRETALQELIKAKEKLNNSYGYLCSLALWIDGSVCKMNQPEFCETWDGDSASAADRMVKIRKATFVSFYISRDMVEKVGLPIKEFFIWADDTNYCLRINHYGQGYLVTDSVVVHKMNTNTKADIVTDNCNRLNRYTFAFRNRFYNYRMEDQTGKFFIYLFKRTSKVLLLAKDHKLRRLKYMYRGVWQGFSFNPKIEWVNDYD